MIPRSYCKYIFKIIFEKVQEMMPKLSTIQQLQLTESDELTKTNTTSSKNNLELLLKELNDLFCIENNKKIILKNFVYFPTLELIKNILEKILKDNNFNNYVDSIRYFFTSLDFIFENLNQILKDVSEFLQSDENHSKIKKFSKKVKKLNVLVQFMKIIITYNTRKNLNLETDFIRNFNTSILKKLIEIIFILLKFNDVESYETINILLDFIINFVQGPNIDNLILLFNSGFLRLVVYLINSIDYAEVIIKNINNNMICDKVNSLIKIEYKVR